MLLEDYFPSTGVPLALIVRSEVAPHPTCYFCDNDPIHEGRPAQWVHVRKGFLQPNVPYVRALCNFHKADSRIVGEGWLGSVAEYEETRKAIKVRRALEPNGFTKALAEAYSAPRVGMIQGGRRLP